MTVMKLLVTADVCAAAGLSAASRRLWHPGISGPAYLDVLQQHDLHEDGVRLLPHLLPHREAIWWGCLCAWEMNRQDEQDCHREAIKAVCRWVSDPSEPNRRAAQAPADADNLRTSSSCLAAAVCWGDAPPADATARLVTAAVLLAAVECEPLHYAEHCRRFLAIGMQVSSGLHRWEGEAQHAAPRSHPPASRERPRSAVTVS